MTSIEDLSNELFYEIFEYLNGCEIYNAFSNLNIRFQNLLTFSSQPLKIHVNSNSKSMIQHYSQQIIIPNKNRIISLRFSNMSIWKYLKLSPIDSSLNCLESIVLNGINSNGVFSCFHRLMSLPRLFSLTLQIDGDLPEVQAVYQFLYNLSVLKYCKISSKSVTKDRWSCSSAKDRYINSIEHLVIDHDCTIDELFNILSYTPRLCYLNCKSVRILYPLRRNVLINLCNLRYISINNFDVDFDKFEIFFEGIHSPIQVLRFKTSQKLNYNDANRWERLITHHMPYLHTFYLQCSINFHDRFGFDQEHEKSNGFTSSFWIERQWIFELQVNMNKTHSTEIIYSIHPYR